MLRSIHFTSRWETTMTFSVVLIVFALITCSITFHNEVYGISTKNNIRKSQFVACNKRFSFPTTTRLSSNKDDTFVNISNKQGQPTTRRTWSPSKSNKNSLDTILEKSWKSGVEVFGEKRRAARQSKNPWWLSEKEQNNPRIFPQYRPWWVENNFLVLDEKAWTVHALQVEARRRGIPSKGKKQELIDRINASYYAYRLTDDNFITPSYTDVGNTT